MSSIKLIQCAREDHGFPPVMEGVFPTGVWGFTSDAVIRSIFKNEVAEVILKDGMVYIPLSMWDSFGLPKIINKGTVSSEPECQTSQLIIK